MKLFDTPSKRASLQADAGRKLLRTGTAPSLLAMSGLIKAYYKVLWLGTAARCGVLAQLSRRPQDAASLASALGLPDDSADTLAAWLDLGASVGLLATLGGRYRLRGLALALSRTSNDALAAFVTELTVLHHPLATEAIDRLRDSRPLQIADADAELIARSSRISDPFLAAAIERVVPPEGPVRLVEVGCGSGAHIRTAAALNPALTARGLELQEGAAALATRNIADWGLAGRVTIEVADVRAIKGAADADLVTLHQNIYYFPVGERVDLLRHLGGFLAPGGRLLVTTICRGSAPTAAGLDLWCASTRDADRLPSASELLQQVRDAGYRDAESVPLTPDGLLCAVVGTWPGAPLT